MRAAAAGGVASNRDCRISKGQAQTELPLKIICFFTHLNCLFPSADFTKKNGTGGESIYGAPFEDEDLSRPIDSEGCVVSFIPSFSAKKRSRHSAPGSPPASRSEQFYVDCQSGASKISMAKAWRAGNLPCVMRPIANSNSAIGRKSPLNGWLWSRLPPCPPHSAVSHSAIVPP